MAIWDDIKRGAQSGLDEVTKLSKVAKLKGQVRNLEATLGDRIYDLGTRVLELHRRNELHHVELDQIFVDIQTLQRELREREAELAGLQGKAAPAKTEAAECPDCGAKLQPADRFCRHCGADIRGK